jgi:hypothetical protein
MNRISTQLRQCIELLAPLAAIGLVVFVSVAVLVLTPATPAAATPEISVYRDPACRCCGGWIEHLTHEGFQPSNLPTADIDALKQQYGVPDALTSCHTAVIDGYVIEGHVPAGDIKRLLAEQPDVVGIAVPGMPIGTPGMESDTAEREAFTVFTFGEQGTTVFNPHPF